MLHHKEFGHIGDRLEEETEEEQNGPDHTHLLGGISSPFELWGDTDDETKGESAKDSDHTSKQQQRKQIGPNNEFVGHSSESPSCKDRHESDEQTKPIKCWRLENEEVPDTKAKGACSQQSANPSPEQSTGKVVYELQPHKQCSPKPMS